MQALLNELKCPERVMISSDIYSKHGLVLVQINYLYCIVFPVYVQRHLFRIFIYLGDVWWTWIQVCDQVRRPAYEGQGNNAGRPEYVYDRESCESIPILNQLS